MATKPAGREKPLQQGENAEPAGGRVRVNVIPTPGDAGTYANFVQVRVTDYDFVLDFAQLLPPVSEDEATAATKRGAMDIPTRARIVIPVAVVPALIDALQRILGEFAKARGLTDTDERSE